MGRADFGNLAVLDTPMLSFQVRGHTAHTTVLVNSQNVERVDLALIFRAKRDDSDEGCGAAGVGNGGIRGGDHRRTQPVTNLFHEALNLMLGLSCDGVGLSLDSRLLGQLAAHRAWSARK